MINYPNSKKAFKRQKKNHSNRGMNFERIINESNDYYTSNDVAVIHKKPIPIQVVKVDYPNRANAVIKEAYYKIPSTTDYNGVYYNHYIDFEAKVTNNKTSFPLSNIHAHQVKHLERCANHGGICFLLIFFKKHDEIYLLESKFVTQYYKRAKKGRKSITYKEIKRHGFLITEGYAPRLDYLKIVKQIIDKKNQ
ncbi:MAG: Holliday junction resolvase RecU [Candidatus Izimaplasma sp.]|nr:Holliday junction resolvase RecU [Candidatus Izimaplasma bacterium]